MNEKNEILAGDVLSLLKSQLKVMKALVLVLILLLAATNIYHVWQWSQFDTAAVENGDNGGYANYVAGDNTGGVYNGERSGTEEEKR